jgi:hypothetical protein
MENRETSMPENTPEADHQASKAGSAFMLPPSAKAPELETTSRAAAAAEAHRWVVRAIFRQLLSELKELQQPVNDNPFPLLSADEIYAIGEESRSRGHRTREAKGFENFLNRERQSGDGYGDAAAEDGGTEGADISADIAGQVAGESAAAAAMDGRERLPEGHGGAGVR